MYKLCIFIILIFTSLASYADGFTLSSDVFLNNGTFPVLYTCDGKDISPQLSWEHLPANTKSLALILSDPDASNGMWYHWVIYNLPPTMNELIEGVTNLPPGALIAKNSWRKTQYGGPCPPKGNAHHYIFTLYALDAILPVVKDASAELVLSIMQEHIIQKTQLIGTYNRLED
jgi:Raf kinase inhibitor-like YbhB/YbcL family protein